jgi:FAD synthase
MLLVTYVDDWLSNMAARDFFEDILVVGFIVQFVLICELWSLHMSNKGNKPEKLTQAKKKLMELN